MKSRKRNLEFKEILSKLNPINIRGLQRQAKRKPFSDEKGEHGMLPFCIGNTRNFYMCVVRQTADS